MTDDYVIDVKGLQKTYGKTKVVDDVALKVKKGSIYGFLGPNGSGKTTSLRMICGLLKPDAGQGTCLGYDIIKDSYKIKLKVGYMTQKFSLYSDLTIYENLDFMARAYSINNRQQKIKQAMDRIGLSEKRSQQLAGNLSGGWKQRLALAAVMLHDPEVLLLDEPTAGVDPKARREFWQQINDLQGEGITTLVTTHYMDEAERCNNITYIAYGKLLTSGSPQQIVDEAGIFLMKGTGDNLPQLAKELEKNPEVLAATLFGESIHVTALDQQALSKIIAPYQKGYHWQEAQPTLEDVFIKLVGEAKDNFK